MRSRIISAIKRLDYRVTVGDVAAKAGLEINQTYTELLILASDVCGYLKVSKSGEIVFQFPKQIRNILYQKFWRVRFHQFWQTICQILFYFLRISFGIILILSIAIQAIAIIIVAIAAIVSEGNFDSCACDSVFVDSSQDRKKSSSHCDDSDDRDRVVEMNFLEAVFSFLFGDGNPNQNLEERRWLLIGDVIRNNRGAIVAEQIAPYLDTIDEISKQHEDYMLPVLIRFNGYPQVSSQGETIYHFPDLQITAIPHQNKQTPEYLEENLWQFTQASDEQRSQILGLGCLNIILSLVLGFLLKTNTTIQLGISGIYWIFLGYSISFLVIPSIRYQILENKNHKINTRNQKRKARTQILKSGDRKLQDKLAYASEFQSQNLIQNEDIIYFTERNLIEQNLQDN